jgi:hypothetical protein
MLERSQAPAGRHRLMALLAISGESRQFMVGICRFGKICLVADPAFLRCPRVFAALLADMAGPAIGNGVHAHQRESPRCVQLEIIPSIGPILRRVTILAGIAKLPPMDVVMAVGAGRTDEGKPQIAVTYPAGGFAMHADQRESRLLMLELQWWFDSRPRFCVMAVKAIPR